MGGRSRSRLSRKCREGLPRIRFLTKWRVEPSLFFLPVFVSFLMTVAFFGTFPFLTLFTKQSITTAFGKELLVS